MCVQTFILQLNRSFDQTEVSFGLVFFVFGMNCEKLAVYVEVVCGEY